MAHDTLSWTEKGRTSLDLLESEDRCILDLSDELEHAPVESVEDRAEWGNRAKLLVRHVATREAALLDVVVGLGGVVGMQGLADRFMGDPVPRRQHMDTVEHLSRGVQGINLNTGQDFDLELASLLEVLRPGLTFDLAEGVPAVRAALDGGIQRETFAPEDHVARHAPTHVDPHRPKWWERAPVISRALTVVQHLRDYPRATRDDRT